MGLARDEAREASEEDDHADDDEDGYNTPHGVDDFFRPAMKEKAHI